MPEHQQHHTADPLQPPIQQQQQQLFTLKPLHVLLVGAGVLSSGILLTGSLSYRQAGKELAAEGIDAALRRRILPHAAKALGGSLLLTGAAAAGCFYIMQELGLVNPDAPTSSKTLATVVDMMLRPQAVQQQVQQEQLQQQQQQQQIREPR